MTITPCIWFDLEAEAAAERYCSVFPNSRITKVTPYPEGSRREAGTTMVVAFELDGRPFVGLNGGTQFTPNEAISFQVPCKDQAEIDHYWDALVDGGEPGPCGWLKDRFGVSWQVFPADLERHMTSPAALEAFFAMQKIDIATLEAAAAGAPA